MKFSKQLLKEIIIEEYNTLLCEAAIADVLTPAIEKFDDKISTSPKSPNYPISHATFKIMNDVLHRRLGIDQAKQRVSKIDRTGSYNKLLIGALESFLIFIHKYRKSDGRDFDSQAINNVSTSLNQAIDNFDNVKALNQRRATYTDDTGDFVPSKLAGRTWVS